MHISDKISENFYIKHPQRSKADLSKETTTKKASKKRYSDTQIQVSEAVIRRCYVKKVSLKVLPPVYLHIIEIEIRW